MRSIVCNLYQNTGSAVLGNQMAVSTNLVRVGTRDLQVDAQLTKVNPGELTVEVQDPAGSIWNFIQTELASSNGLLPPWLQLAVGGNQEFLGTIDPCRIVRHLAANRNTIELGAQDWSVQLANTYLGAPSANPWASGKAYPEGSQALFQDNVYQSVPPAAWAAGGVYPAGSLVPASGGAVYLATTGGTAATTGSGPSGTGTAIADGSVVWEYIAVPTSGSTGPAGTGSAITDGSVTWAYVPPGWQRPVPQVAANRPTSQTVQGLSPDIYWIAGGLPSSPFDPLFSNVVIIPGGANFAQQGDRITVDLSPAETAAGFSTTEDVGVIYTVMDVKTPPDPSVIAAPGNNSNGFAIYNPNNLQLTQFTLNLTAWPYDLAQAAINSPNLGPSEPIAANFTRLPNVSTDANYYSVVKAVGATSQGNNIWLNTVDGIFPQDRLQCVHGSQSASWTVLSINPELMNITTSEAVTNLNIGDEIYFDAATNAEMVMEDARSVVAKAAWPFRVDVSRFVKQVLPMPVFGWLPLRGTAGASDLMAISDLDTALVGGVPLVRAISGYTNAYHGSPENGWTAETPAALPACQPQYADWTQQLSAAPASLMPYTIRTANPATGAEGDSPFSMLRNRAYSEWGAISSWQAHDNGPVPWYQAPGWQNAVPAWSGSTPSTWYDPWAPAGAGALQPIVFYDYLQMRKVVVITAGDGSQTITSYPWNGSSWGAGVALGGWTGLGTITSLSNWPGGPSGALLALVEGAEVQLLPAGGGAVTPVAIPAVMEYGQLVPTLQGVYLLGPQGYALLTSGATLQADPPAANFPDQITALWPNTFVARTAMEAVVMGRKDTGSGTGTVSTTSILFRLKTTPDNSTPLASIILSEVISNGSPTFAGAILDPTKAGRVIGHYGGALWQVDTEAPWTVERFTPQGMTALECIEHVCQLYGAMAVPLPSGVMAIISRGVSENPIALTVLQETNDQALCWEHFYSIIRCTTQDGQTYYDAPVLGGKVGGKLMEINNHPMLWSLSQCGAMAENYSQWFGTPRASETHTWTYPDANTAAPWEALEPFARVMVNGTGPWRIMGTTMDYIKGTCKAVLVED